MRYFVGYTHQRKENTMNLWTDATFQENLDNGYAMIKILDLGKPSEEITYFETYPDDDRKHGDKISVFRNTFTVEEMIEEYQHRKKEIDDFTGETYPETQEAYKENPYLILDLSAMLQMYHGWLIDGYPNEKYSLSELSRKLGAY